MSLSFIICIVFYAISKTFRRTSGKVNSSMRRREPQAKWKPGKQITPSYNSMIDGVAPVDILELWQKKR
jgi:hypothetical protein